MSYIRPHGKTELSGPPRRQEVDLAIYDVHEPGCRNNITLRYKFITVCI